jgi:hypothetical protein
MSADNGGPAFPRPIGHSGAQDFHDREVSGESEGMSFRAWAAGKALQGILASDMVHIHRDGLGGAELILDAPGDIPMLSVTFADALIAELKK